MDFLGGVRPPVSTSEGVPVLSTLDRLRELEAKATPGPWRYHRSIFPPSDKINYAYVSFGKDDGETSGLGTGTLSEADARFLAAAVEYARAALTSEAHRG